MNTLYKVVTLVFKGSASGTLAVPGSRLSCVGWRQYPLPSMSTTDSY